MTWIRTHYDRVAVLAAALFLFASALLIIREVAQFGENFAVLQAPPPPKPAAPPPKAVEMEQARRNSGRGPSGASARNKSRRAQNQAPPGLQFPQEPVNFLRVEGQVQAQTQEACFGQQRGSIEQRRDLLHHRQLPKLLSATKHAAAA